MSSAVEDLDIEASIFDPLACPFRKSENAYGRREGPGSISDFAFVIVIPKVGGSNLGPEYIVLSGLCA